MKNLTHHILRTYVAVVRGEHFAPTQSSEKIEFIAPYSGRQIAAYPVTDVVYSDYKTLRELVCNAWDISEDTYFELMIIPKPTRLQNRIYSATLKRIFGIENLRFNPAFDKDGNFILPKERGFFMPVRENNQITKLQFFDYYAEFKKKAA